MQPVLPEFTMPPLLQLAAIAASPFRNGLPPKLALNDTDAGDSTAGTTTRAAVPATTVKVTDVTLPAASAIVIGTEKPPQPSATANDVNRKIPPWLATLITCPELVVVESVPAFGKPFVMV